MTVFSKNQGVVTTQRFSETYYFKRLLLKFAAVMSKKQHFAWYARVHGQSPLHIAL